MDQNIGFAPIRGLGPSRVSRRQWFERDVEKYGVEYAIQHVCALTEDEIAVGMTMEDARAQVEDLRLAALAVSRS